MVADVPVEWGWSVEIRDAMKYFLVQRAEFLATRLQGLLTSLCNLDPGLDFRDVDG
jgi:hypothetical protein